MSAISGICVNIGICHLLGMAMHETKIGRVFENQTSIQAFSSWELAAGLMIFIDDLKIWKWGVKTMFSRMVCMMWYVSFT